MVKYFVFSIAMLLSTLSFAKTYEMKESQFSIEVSIKRGSADTVPVEPAFDFAGSVLWVEEVGTYELPVTKLTVRRTTFECDNAGFSFEEEFSCGLYGMTFLKFLEEVVTHNDAYAEVQGILKRHFDQASEFESVEIPLGVVGQASQTEFTQEITDPENLELAVQLKFKTTGMVPL